MYDYLDYIEQRAFSEGYCSRMIEEQREYGVQSLINGFKKARDKGHGLLDSANIARKRSNLARTLKDEGRHFDDIGSLERDYLRKSERTKAARMARTPEKLEREASDKWQKGIDGAYEGIRKFEGIKNRAISSRSKLEEEALAKLERRKRHYKYYVTDRINRYK